MIKKSMRSALLIMIVMVANNSVATEIDHSKMDHSKHMMQMVGMSLLYYDLPID